MTKILVIPNKLNFDEYDCDGFILGLKNYSVNMPYSYSLEDIKNIKTDKEIFICMNKNIFSSELDEVKNILLELDKLNIKGVLYADTCFVKIKKDLNLKLDLVWSQEHLTTNYETINYWNEFGVNYVYISSDITYREIKEIKKSSKAKLIVPLFGYMPIFTSFRHEVKNYLDEFNLKDNSDINYIYKEDLIYPIVDNEIGTVVYSNYILNGYKEYKELEVDYVALNSFNIDDEDFKNVLKVFKEKKLDDLEFKNSSKGFLYNETIYKVKR